MSRIVENLVDKKFGRLTVLERVGSKNHFALWLCRCTCGVLKKVTSGALKTGTKSCGCLRLEALTRALKVNRVGQRFGRLVVVREAPPKATKWGARAQWLCRCDCGQEKVVAGSALAQGVTQSCGCLGRENRLRLNTKHGQSRRNARTTEYTMFIAARTRAKRDHLPFTLTLADIKIPALCPVFGVPLQCGTRANHEYSPSLDRRISELGYIPLNVQVISYKANRIKNNATLEELEKIVAFMRGNIHG